MIQTEVKQSRAIPGFSCLQIKQELQERVRMSDEEFIEHLRKGAERFDRKNGTPSSRRTIGYELKIRPLLFLVVP